MDGKLTGRISSVGSLTGTLSAVGGLSGTLSPGSDSAPAYQGETVFTPTNQTQTIQASGYLFSENITINPIPSNYGRITWNGSTLTVS